MSFQSKWFKIAGFVMAILRSALSKQISPSKVIMDVLLPSKLYDDNRVTMISVNRNSRFIATKSEYPNNRKLQEMEEYFKLMTTEEEQSNKQSNKKNKKNDKDDSSTSNATAAVKDDSNKNSKSDKNKQATNEPTVSPTIIHTLQPSTITTTVNNIKTTNQTQANANITSNNTIDSIAVFFSILPENTIPKTENNIILNEALLNEIISFATKSLCHELEHDIIITDEDIADYSNVVVNVCNTNTNERRLFEEPIILLNKNHPFHENTTVLQYTIPRNESSSLLSIIEKKIFDVTYYEINMKYNVLKVGNFLNHNELQEEAQAGMIRSILKYHADITLKLLNQDIIQDVSIIGNELSTFDTYIASSTQTQKIFTQIRVSGILIFCITMFLFSWFCYVANYKKNKDVDDMKLKKKVDKTNSKEIVIDSQEGVDYMLDIAIDEGSSHESDDVIVSTSSRSVGSKIEANDDKDKSATNQVV